MRLLARGGGEEESGEGEGGECRSQRERVDEHENDNAERESRGEDRAYTPFLFDLRPSHAAGEGEERGEDGRRTPAWMCHTVIFSTRSQNHAGAAAVACRAASPVRGGSGLNRCLEIPNKNQER